MTVSRKQIEDILRVWKNFLDLQSWQINVEVFNEPPPTECDSLNGCKLNMQAEILVHFGYFNADLRVYAYQIHETELEQVLVHELTHIVLHQLQHFAKAGMGEKYEDVVTEALEQATERVSQSLAKLAREAREARVARKAKRKHKRNQKQRKSHDRTGERDDTSNS